MVALTRRIARDDDDIEYDPRYPGKRVVADGGRVRVPVMLTDGQPPEWMRAARRPLFDASQHRPRYAVVDASDPHVRAAEAAYADRNKWLQDAWRQMGGGGGGEPLTTAPPADEPDDDETLSPRDQYIKNLQTAYRGSASSTAPISRDPRVAASAVEAQRQRWLKPGARPGTTKDAAISDRDQAYGEYLDRISNGWRR